MSLVATACYGLTWTDGDGHPLKLPQCALVVPYTTPATGTLPVPANTPSATEFDLPLVGIATGATLFLVENATGQELAMAYANNFAPSLPPGGVFLFAAPTPVSSGGRPITSWRFMLTQTQASPGGINYWALGA